MPNDKTLRDEFAMAALTGFVAGGVRTDLDNDDIAKVVFAMADAMLKERSQEGGDGK